jgi:hypothetical protein
MRRQRRSRGWVRALSTARRVLSSLSLLHLRLTELNAPVKPRTGQPRSGASEEWGRHVLAAGGVSLGELGVPCTAAQLNLGRAGESVGSELFGLGKQLNQVSSLGDEPWESMIAGLLINGNAQDVISSSLSAPAANLSPPTPATVV